MTGHSVISLARVLVRRPEIHFRVIPPTPSSNPVVASSKEGNSGRDFTDYVSAIHDPGGAFDLIVIDGRAREACLLAALQHLEPDGADINFDNSRRRPYR